MHQVRVIYILLRSFLTLGVYSSMTQSITNSEQFLIDEKLSLQNVGRLTKLNKKSIRGIIIGKEEGK